MSERAAYSRVYWSILDDPKFVSVYDDDRNLATWLRLLLAADQSHPASATIPIGTRRTSVAALVTAGLVDLGPGSRYRIHGLDAERERRRLAATTVPRRYPNGTRTGPERDPTGIQTPGLRRDETRRDETRHVPAPRRVPEPKAGFKDPLLAEIGAAVAEHYGDYGQETLAAIEARKR